MKFNFSILSYFVFVFMAMFICAQAQAQGGDCRIKVYNPRQGSTYQFDSRQIVNYGVSNGCFTSSYF